MLGLGKAQAGPDDLKAFGAAFATTSAAPLFHIAGVTPEAIDPAQVLEAGTRIPVEKIRLQDLMLSWRELNSARDPRVDVVSLGNPHFSLGEFAHLARLCRVGTSTRTWCSPSPAGARYWNRRATPGISR